MVLCTAGAELRTRRRDVTVGATSDPPTAWLSRYDAWDPKQTFDTGHAVGGLSERAHSHEYGNVLGVIDILLQRYRGFTAFSQLSPNRPSSWLVLRPISASATVGHVRSKARV
ncbi:hypothetical protein BU26DRAFT_506658 [Trematosphaeria pertusa]|uniref:Uncharacterized protein n=1 Tax=Trematosphaeria pertusa TaxID=390896 RepID=A0A6A6ID34_9PLEO|nr:uncharacterized protein BU26DRAFT_506658 [Trematosphaeria pertusa]KAF2247413.1 hypothetical protein BU26DRAFT_506658 [Trematosphaeria pertusa]